MLRRIPVSSKLTAGSLAGPFSITLPALGRFVPPWKAHGFDSADEFFHGVARSRNPIERLKRDVEREEKEQENEQNQLEQQRLELEEHEKDLAAIQQRNEEAVSKANSFLPYGATPERVGANGLAAWGVYKASLASEVEAKKSSITVESKKSASTGEKEADDHEEEGDGTYSVDTMQLLMDDMEIALDYKLMPNLPSSPDAGAIDPTWPFNGTVGVVLDIDGVVYKSRKVIEGSDTAIKFLIKNKIPFLFMTNGGGKTEAAKAKELEEILGLDASKGEVITADQIIMSHTPMQLLVPHYKDDNVLILGNPTCEEVALGYGFKNAIGMEEFQRQHPELVPFKQWQRIVQATTPSSGSAGGVIKTIKTEVPNSIPYPEIAAVLSFSDSMDAFNDTQVVVDILTSPYGRIGSGVSGEQTVPFYSNADDLLWATEAPLPRLGGGAFREMVSHTYKCVTGSDIQIVQYGKPRAIAYHFAEKRLKKLSGAMHGWDPSNMRCITMVGDNLDTDILGANGMGEPWLSVHVLSGIGGGAVAAHRTTPMGDDEMKWLQSGGPGGEPAVNNTPHYVAPTLDHFVRELTNFPESHVTSNWKGGGGGSSLARPFNPAPLVDVYNLDPFALTV